MKFESDEINDFNDDLEYSLDKSDDKSLNEFYRRIFPPIKEIEFKSDIKVQKRGIDKSIYLESGGIITIDEKKRREDYGDILIEIWSSKEDRIRGWLLKSECNYIVYIIEPANKVYLLPTLLLRLCWEDNKEKWKNKYPQICAKNKGYTTVSYAMPTEILLSSIEKQMSYKIYSLGDK